MKFPKTKLYEACESKKDGRPILTGVHVNADKARLEAADGVILAVIPIPEEDAQEIGNTVIPAKIMKEAYNMARRSSQVPTIKVTESGYTVGAQNASGDPEPITGPTYPLEVLATDGISYPDCDKIIPDPKHYEFVAALDVNKLMRLAKAICENGTRRPDLFVKLYRDRVQSSAPLRVVPLSTEHKDRLGLIMPMHVVEES